MESKELYRLCGIRANSLVCSSTEPKWVQAKLKFIGAERYVLGTKCIDVAVEQAGHGFRLVLRRQQDIDTSVLMGPKRILGMLYDVDVVMPSLTLSLASLCPGRYPQYLRVNENVKLV